MGPTVRQVAIALCLLLAGCGGNAVQPPYGGHPITSIPRPGTQAFALDLSAPSIGLGMACSGDVPPDCSSLPTADTYGTFPAPGGWGADCVDPGPNPCYAVDNGVLRLRAPGTAFPIITRQTFSRDGVSMQFTASAECLAQGCWGGLVVYSGDALPGTGDLNTGEWLGIYFSHADNGMVQMGVWGPSKVYQIPGMVFPAGTLVTGRMDYIQGQWSCFVQGQQVSCGTDTRTLHSDPHAALFLGDLNMNVSAWDVYTP